VREVANEYSGQLALRRRMTYHITIQFEARDMADPIQQAIKLIEAGKLDQAQAVLLDRLKIDPQDDAAWYWMSKVAATDELREECLREALKVNPKNTLARAALNEMQPKPAAQPGKWSTTESAAPKTKSRSVSVGPQRHPNTLPFAIIIFGLALSLIAVTYLFTREDLAYRSEGRVVSATVTDLIKDRGSEGQTDRCQAEYQFMAYGALRKGTAPILCADWDRLDDARRMQIQYLNSQPDRSRAYPPAQTTERYAVMGFGLAALLIIVGIVLVVWRFWPQKSER
jgi:hypothetical protein